MNQETGKRRLTVVTDPAPARLNPEAMENLKALEEMGVEGVFRELAESFVRETPAKIELLRELASNLAANHDLTRLARCAHDLKNTSATLGADTLSETSHLLERQAKTGDLEGAAELIDAVAKEYSRVEAALFRELQK